LLAVGLLTQQLASRRAAYIRHLLLTVTFGAALALPLVVLSVPRISLAVPALPHSASPAEMAAPEGVSAQPRAVAGTRFKSQTGASRSLPSSQTIIRLGWMTGCVLVLLPLVLDIRRLQRLRRDGIPAPELEAHLQKLAAASGIRTRVELLLLPDIAGPLTCGVMRPAILLPDDARAWCGEDLRRALVHELEHVRRGDWAVQLIARTTCALYWFHPLVWIAWRKLSLEAERACDDAVLQREESTAYAEQLVSLARRLTRTAAQPALGMARRSDLSARVRAVLDTGQKRGRASGIAVATAASVALLIAIVLGPVRAVAQSAQPADRRPPAKGEQSRRSTPFDAALLEAAERGDNAEVEQLLSAGANVNAQVRGDGSPLIAAARKGHDTTVTLLLNRGADPNVGVAGDGSPLIVAAQNRHLSTVRLLLDRGADIRMPVPGDGNPLIMAARGGSVDVVELLLNRGADIEQVVPGDENALIEASASGRLAVARLLISRGANVNSRVWVEPSGDRPGEYRSPLSMARRNGHTAVADYLRSAGARE
jgi:beta-lactamase regulating signal transducer with metallopeptidase domain